VAAVAVVTHSDRSRATEALRRTRRVVQAAGVALHPVLGDALGAALIAGPRPIAQPPSGVGLCLALGGDGTILRALRGFAGAGVPVVGFNLGTKGFLAAYDVSQIERGVRTALDGEIERVGVPSLTVRLQLGGPWARGVNDVAVVAASRRPGRVITRVDDIELADSVCDGMIVSTPVGSTGYSLAVGAPPMAWGTGGVLVTTIAPRRLDARPVVVAASSRVVCQNRSDRPLRVLVDGVDVGSLAAGDELAVTAGAPDAVLGLRAGGSFYERLHSVFGPMAGPNPRGPLRSRHTSHTILT
jgi:NAD+ kinase